MFHLADYKLRQIEDRDSLVLAQWHNADHIRASSFNDSIVTPEERQRWFDSLGNDRRSKRLIFELQQVPLGLLTFQNIDTRHSTAHWGFYLGDTNLPKGTGTVLTFCGLEYAFGELHIRKIIAEILASNSKSVKLHQKLGFVNEGHFHEHIFKNGAFHDVLIFALFARQWREKFRATIETKLFVNNADHLTA